MSKYHHRWHEGSNIDLTVGKVVCVGKNYADHVKEMERVFSDSSAPELKEKQAVLFLKPNTAVCNANQNIPISHLTHLGELHNELEIALLIGESLDRRSKNHIDAIIGIGLALDLTLREVQADLKNRGLPWERSKAFDGSCPLSGFIPFSSSQTTLELDNLDLELTINEQVRQRGNSSMMLTPIEPLLVEITTLFSLEPGDIVLTGTPAGVGPLHAGDVINATLNQQTLIDASKFT